MKPINKTIFIIIILIMSLMQFSLIAHRLSFDSNLLFNFYKKDYGIIESLKIDEKFSSILDIKNISKNNDLKNFQLSKELKGSSSYARMVEVSYPIKINSKSRYYFALKDEIVKKCVLIENLKEINLYDCGK
tara:strand:- start:1059 stop:1454 length:396 start_codon:yes stop_codon:yes gene_type:complete